MPVQARARRTQPKGYARPASGVRWGFLLNGAFGPLEALSSVELPQQQSTNPMIQSIGVAGQCYVPSGASSQNAALRLPPAVAGEAGAVVGTSFLWYGLITATTNNPVRDTVFGRHATNTLTAANQAQFRLRLNTSNEILVEVNNGSSLQTASSGLIVTPGQPLAILAHFTAAGIDFYTSVGSASVAVTSMPTSVGSSTRNYVATIGSSTVAFNGHPFHQCALAGWSPSHLPLHLVDNPWASFAPRRVWVPQGAAAGLPTLSLPTFVPGSITPTGFRPRVTAT